MILRSIGGFLFGYEKPDRCRVFGTKDARVERRIGNAELLAQVLTCVNVIDHKAVGCANASCDIHATPPPLAGQARQRRCESEGHSWANSVSRTKAGAFWGTW
jgi:hypothetical protein